MSKVIFLSMILIVHVVGYLKFESNNNAKNLAIEHSGENLMMNTVNSMNVTFRPIK